MKFDRELLDSMVEEGWLHATRHSEADLWIFNYTAKCQFDRHWTPETLACRGLILDGEGGVVARSFSKFFNMGEHDCPPIPDEPYSVTEKIDGSLGIFYELDGEWFIASRGSFDSEQAREGTAMLRDAELMPPVPGTTPVFEILYPSNRIVVHYGDRRELVLLAAIDKETGKDAIPPPYGGPSARFLNGDDALDRLHQYARPNSEGFVVRFLGGLRVKVKFEEYVRLHRIVSGLNTHRIWDSLRSGDDVRALLSGIPDELYDWALEQTDRIEGAYEHEVADVMRVFNERPKTDDRKTLALYFKDSGANTAALFRILDGKSGWEDMVWKALEPKAERPAFATDAAET